MIDICLCTHNPRRDTVHLVVEGLARQQCDPHSFRVLVVDNASDPPVPESLLEPLRAKGIEARIARESGLGIARARLRAAKETTAEWILFVDDDTELLPDYVANGIDFAAKHPDVGCFGGKLILPPSLQPPAWVVPFLPFLAIKEAGSESIIERSEAWGVWEPPTAGAFVRRSVIDRYCRSAAEDDRLFRLGRTGRSNLSSCEDSLMMKGAFALGLASAYCPALVLHHHLDPQRFRFRYLIRLMNAYGASHVLLERLMRGTLTVPPYYRSRSRFAKLLARSFLSSARRSIAYGIGMCAYHLGARKEYLRDDAA